MENPIDSLEKTAHAYGITDVELDKRIALLRQQAQEEAEEADRLALLEFQEQSDIDYGYHDFYDF